GRDDVGRDRRVVVGGREDGDLVAEADEVRGQVADVELHSARHVPGVGADDPDSHAGPAACPVGFGALAGSRSASQSFCSMCQSAGCSAMPCSKTSTSAWHIAAIFSSRLPVSGTSIFGCTLACWSPVSSQSVTGISAAAVAIANAAGPAGSLVVSPKN